MLGPVTNILMVKTPWGYEYSKPATTYPALTLPTGLQTGTYYKYLGTAYRAAINSINAWGTTNYGTINAYTWYAWGTTPAAEAIRNRLGPWRATPPIKTTDSRKISIPEKRSVHPELTEHIIIQNYFIVIILS